MCIIIQVLVRRMPVADNSFVDCTGLTSINFPEVVIINADNAFSGCTGLQSVNFPKVEKIDCFAFSNTGTGSLTITLGTNAPDLGYGIFFDVNKRPRAVTIQVPANTPAANYGILAFDRTYSGKDYDECWGNGFRGSGWSWEKGGSSLAYDPPCLQRMIKDYTNTGITLTMVKLK